MEDRAEYEKTVDPVARTIRAWDPYRPIANGAAVDEFDNEIVKIRARRHPLVSHSLWLSALRKLG